MERKFLTTDEILDTPGTYFNPSTEVTVTVDDSDYIDLGEVNLEKYSADEWVTISEEPLNDSSVIGETLENVIELEGGFLNIQNLSETSKEQQD